MPYSRNKSIRVSFVVPIYNEGAGIEVFHNSLVNAAEKATDGRYEIIYVDDGSIDNTHAVILALHEYSRKVRIIRLSRNFGKESALSAGIFHARGQAVMMLDGDGQHPVELIPQFIALWQHGAKVVVGIRRSSQSDAFVKKIAAQFFYVLINKFAAQGLVAGSTDYRLIDREVQGHFLQLRENDRITRGLIDWLGFQRAYVYFDANERKLGKAQYSYRKLVCLARSSFVSLTPTPLYLFGYLGILVTTLAGALGAVIMLEQIFLGDPLHWRFTGTAMLAILIIFLVGILLLSQAVVALYIASIQTQSRQRPLYVVDYQQSKGINADEYQT